MFGNALMILNEGRYNENQLYEEFFSVQILDTLMNQYLLSLGEFHFENFQPHSQDLAAWIVFILSTFIVQILFLNLLIAAMGDTYDQVKDSDKQTSLKETIKLMSTYAIVVKRYTKDEELDNKFIYTVQKETQGEEELSEWEGKLTQLKRHFSFATDGHNVMVTNRVQKVDDKLRKFQEKFTEQNFKVDKMQAILKDKMTELQSNQNDMNREILSKMSEQKVDQQ